MSTTIANQLIDLNINLNEIYNQTAEQTKLIGDLYDTIESLSTPVAQPTPVLLVDTSTGQVTSTLTQSQSGYVAAGTKIASLNLKDLANTGLIPSNIIAGATIFGVEGTASSGIDTSDATARPEYIRSGSTAYVNGQKITGTAEVDTSFFRLGGLDPDSASEIDFYLSLDPNKTYLLEGGFNPAVRVPLEVFGDATAANVRKNKTFTSSSGYSVTGTMPDVAHVKPSISINAANGIVTASHTTVAGYTDAGTTSNTLQLSVQGATTITPSALEQTAVAAGFYTKGAVKVAGDIDLQAANIRNGVSIFNVTGTYTSDATADATHILRDKIAYSKGSKITGTMANNGSWSCTGINAGAEYTIPAGYHTGRGKVIANSLSGQTQATATAANIAEGKTAWVNGTKITGTMTDHGAVAMALALGGTYKIPAGYHNGSGKVTTQSLSSQTPGTAAASHIISGKTAWVNGSKITGTLKDYHDKYIEMDSVHYDGDINFTKTIEEGMAIEEGGMLKAYLAGDAFGDAAVANVLSGKTFTSTNGLKLTGTMTNQGAKTASLNTSTTSYTIPAGYHNGKGKVSISTEQKTVTPSASLQTIKPSSGKVLSQVNVKTDINLKAANIKSGVTIFGVTGTYSAGGSANITDLTNTTWIFHYDLDNYWQYGSVGFPWNLNFTSNNTNYTQIRYEDNSDDSNDRREMYYNNTYAYMFDTGLHNWWTDEQRTIHITGGTDVKNANVIANLQKLATLVDNGNIEALGALCDWDIMTNESSHPVITIYNRHPTYYLKCTLYNDNDTPAIYDDGNGDVIEDGEIIVSPDDWATFIIEEAFVDGYNSQVYIRDVRWTKNV